ncbi:MAG: hypothetical protein KY460_03670 [Actinobacteria bacterium]|nr:hypothetical protein [Actinomycetota bacterium]
MRTATTTSTTAARVALATAAGAIDLDDDAPPLIAALAGRGIASRLCVWDDATVDWAAWDLVVLRSTWDYPRRYDAFVRWVTDVAAATRVCNPPEVVTWNSDKRYLLELAGCGVGIVPSAVYGPGSPVKLPDDGRFVVKPTVSAGAQDTVRYDRTGHADALAHTRRIQSQGRHVLVQPYVEHVDDRGETALVFMGGRFSHAIRKGPILTGAPETVGGLFAAEDIRPRTPTDHERAAAELALDALPFDRTDLLYARVDLLPGPDGTPLLLEVELVEPSLFLRFCDGAPDRLARSIAAHLDRYA